MAHFAGFYSCALAIAFRPDGGFFAAGEASIQANSPYHFQALAAFRSDGSQLTGFGKNPKASIYRCTLNGAKSAI